MEGVKLEAGELRINYTLAASGLNEDLAAKYEADSANGILVLLNVQADGSMKDEGTAREIINRVQKLRKEAKLVPTDQIRVYYRLLPVDLKTAEKEKETTPVDLARVVVDFREYILASLKADFVDLASSEVKAPAEFLISSRSDIKGEPIELAIERISQTTISATSATQGKLSLVFFKTKNIFFIFIAKPSPAKKSEAKAAKAAPAPAPAPGPGPPFVRYSNFQLKSGVRTVAKTVLCENPVGSELPSLLCAGWSEAGEQGEPLNKYVNVEVVGGDESTKNRATVLLETVTSASPFLSKQMTDLAELRLNVSVQSFLMGFIFCCLSIDCRRP